MKNGVIESIFADPDYYYYYSWIGIEIIHFSLSSRGARISPSSFQSSTVHNTIHALSGSDSQGCDANRIGTVGGIVESLGHPLPIVMLMMMIMMTPLILHRTNTTVAVRWRTSRHSSRYRASSVSLLSTYELV